METTMQDVIDILQKQGYILYLTMWLLRDMTIMDWQLWAIVVPTIVLVNWKRKDE